MQRTPCLKFWIVSFFIMLCFGNTMAQLNHYVYLQTDDQQPFYIKYNNRVYSSSAGGYLILAKLKDGPVSFLTGFPKSGEAEQKFEYVVDKADKGFLIKKFAEKGWGLYDLQNSAIIYALGQQTQVADVKVNNQAGEQTANDPFANMLAKVTQDSTVKNVVVKQEETVIVDTPKQVVQLVKADTPTPEKKPVPPVVTVSAPVQTEPVWVPPAKSLVTKLKVFETKAGSDLIYEVKNENNIGDTIRIFIPAAPVKQLKEEPVVSKPEIKKDTIIPQVVEEKKEVLPQQPQPVTVETPVAKEKPIIPDAEKKPEIKSAPNSNCSTQASEDDFVKLRRRMAAQSRDEGMINEAKKVFKNKCFSALQLKNLAVLFLSDEWRYRFYDAALSYVSDFSNFKNLAETIQDEYYKKRFMALLPN